MAVTIASVSDVKKAGNISDRVDTETLQFYLGIASMLFEQMVGSVVYAAAVASPPTVSATALRKFKYSEALMTVGFALPCLAMEPSERGLLNVISHGAGGQLEKFSFTKEVQELAATFMNLAQQLSAGYIVEEGYENVWHNVVMRLFPSLDEMPTVAMLHSYEEGIIQARRGDETFQPEDL